MIIAACILGYLVLAVLTMAVALRLRPDWYYDKQLHYGDAKDALHWCSHDYDAQRRDCADCGEIRARMTRVYAEKESDSGAFFCSAAGWPVTCLVILFSMVRSSVQRGLNNDITTRAALEQELAAARKEVDALLRQEPA